MTKTLKLTRTVGITLLFFVLATSGFAQEMLVELNANLRLNRYEDYLRMELSNGSRAAGDTLDLPFFDDFSEPFTKIRSLRDDYPNSDRWIGNTVYINNHMAINPISQGVATFDGLDENGRAYGFGFTLPTLSDSLTSKPLRLAGATDTVILTFYYQAQGMGNAPEVGDILELEFKDTADNWNPVWEAAGYTLSDYAFRLGMVEITDEAYLYDGFQFRFMNYASRAGSTDHWHLDYVKLDQGRNAADTIIRDVSHMCQTSYLPDDEVFQNTTFSLLNEYSSMPWDHYKEDPSAFVGDTAYFVGRNNFDDSFSPSFSVKVRDHQGNQLYEGLTSTSLMPAGVICGNELNTCNTGSANNFNFSIGGTFDAFPTGTEITPDSMYFTLEYLLDVDDDVDTNNLLVEQLEFYNYYAYDDGTAELAYGLGELENVGMAAMKYDIKKRDTLRAIMMYLNPVADDISAEPVNLAVWTGNNEPETMIWMSPDTNLYYSDQINQLYQYELDTAIDVEGSIWIGWIQQPATGIKFSIGFDQRRDVSTNLFYNLGTVWSQSTIPGAVMIRPTFGKDYDWQVGIQEHTYAQVSVYPNPSTGVIRLKETESGQFQNASISVVDLSGRIVHQQTGYQNSIDLQFLNKGSYILRIESENRLFTQRIILQ